MKTELLIDALGDVSDDYILDACNLAETDDIENEITGRSHGPEDRNGIAHFRKDGTFEADSKGKKKVRDIFCKNTMIKYISAAACLCLIVITVITVIRSGAGRSASIQQWTESMAAKDYFKNSTNTGRPDSASASIVMPPFAILLPLDDSRQALEEAGIIPVIADHTEHSFAVMYNGDGSLYKISFRWGRRGEGIEEYSDLIFRAAPKEIREISDTVAVRTDPSGNVIPPYVTVTERDGITILAEGAENENKTLTWQTDKGWFQVQGSFKDSYEDVIAFFDWFWAHPFDLSGYASVPDDLMIRSTRAEYPDAFSGMIPDLTSLGYTAVSESVNLGSVGGAVKPVWFEGIYTRGETRIRWTINTGADADAWAHNIGRPSEITEEKLARALSGQECVNIFFDLPCMATLTVESGSAADAMEIVRTLQ